MFYYKTCSIFVGMSKTAINGGRPDLIFFRDELAFMENYTPEQVDEIFKSAMPIMDESDKNGFIIFEESGPMPKINIIEIPISKDDFILDIEEAFNFKIESTIKKLIEYLRHNQKTYLSEVDGLDSYTLLHQIVQNGNMNPSLYVHIINLIDNPDLEYTIKITK